MGKVWVFRYGRDVAKRGDKASWYVGWYDPEGRRKAESCGPGTRGKRLAERRARQIEAALLTGTYEAPTRTTWPELRELYWRRVASQKAPGTQTQIRISLDHFERICHPGRLDRIGSGVLEDFVATRLTERGVKRGSRVSAATVNKDLRHIRAVLRAGHRWGLVARVPEVPTVREPEKLARYVTPEHFAAIYRQGCPEARLPRNPRQRYEPADWWRAILVFAYLTGWRIGSILALRWENVDLEAGLATVPAEATKARRAIRTPLNGVVVDHLRPLVDFHPLVFRWCHRRDTLWEEFGRIQEAAGIRLACREDHQHTPACHTYGFHDLRRAFATENALHLAPEALREMMGHRDYTTTQRYINMARQVVGAAEQIRVPEFLRAARGRSVVGRGVS